MKIVAISVGRPREVQWRGRSVQTSIFKTPVPHRVHVTSNNIEGDQQSDLSVHGGLQKAVYAYPAEHYDFWRRELPDAKLPWGAFGENFTTEGLLEDDVWIGDRVKRFLESRRSGFYLAVEREGEVGTGDAIERLARSEPRLTVADVVALYAADSTNQPLLESASEHPSLPAAWRDYFRKRLWTPDA